MTQLIALISLTVALENGLLKTPPMGWMAWERFRCDIDCKDDPENCIRYYRWGLGLQLCIFSIDSCAYYFHNC